MSEDAQDEYLWAPSAIRRDRRPIVAYEDAIFSLKRRARRMGASHEITIGLIQKGIEYVDLGLPVCESPIEGIMLPPLVFADWHGFENIPVPVYLDGSDDPAPDSDIIIVPQMRFGRYRADFAIVCQAGDARKIFFVECDGSDFHQDAAHDLARDGYLKTLGITLIRLTGREISANAASALQKVVFVVTAWKDAQKAVAA